VRHRFIVDSPGPAATKHDRRLRSVTPAHLAVNHSFRRPYLSHGRTYPPTELRGVSGGELIGQRHRDPCPCVDEDLGGSPQLRTPWEVPSARLETTPTNPATQPQSARRHSCWGCAWQSLPANGVASRLGQREWAALRCSVVMTTSCCSPSWRRVMRVQWHWVMLIGVLLQTTENPINTPMITTMMITIRMVFPIIREETPVSSSVANREPGAVRCGRNA
jgi:hypothetical protein